MTDYTINRGERHPSARLKEPEVIEIMALAGKMPQRAIAQKFGVSQVSVSLIHTGKAWAWLFKGENRGN